MTSLQPNLVYLPLRRRAGLVRAFAWLVRALPELPPPADRRDVPDYLRRDLGLPPPDVPRRSQDRPDAFRGPVF